MWKANVLLGLSTGLISLYVFSHSFTLVYSVAFGPGPGFSPRWVSIALLVVSIGYVAENLRRRDEGDGFPMTYQSALRALGIFLVLGASILLMNLVGFVISMALFMIVVLKMFEGRSWSFSIIAGCASTAGVFVLFAVLFEVPLPRLLPGVF